MKRRFSSHMTLIELTLALFFLMLAMVTIIGLFTTAYNMSDDAERLTRAVQLAQDCAALIESGAEPRAALAENGYEMAGEADKLTYAAGDLAVSVLLKEEQTEVGFLYTGTIEVKQGASSHVEWPVARYINKEVIRP